MAVAHVSMQLARLSAKIWLGSPRFYVGNSQSYSTACSAASYRRRKTQQISSEIQILLTEIGIFEHTSQADRSACAAYGRRHLYVV